MEQDVLASQKAYYDARAAEYDESLHFRRGSFAGTNPEAADLARLQQFVRLLPRVDATVELGCGTGIWTRELSATTRSLHAVDSSPKMIALNSKFSDSAVTFECADIFDWKPARRFDRVAAAFLLSHVPESLLCQFIRIIDDLILPGGSILLIDEETALNGVSTEFETRELADGTRFKIIKLYRSLERMDAILSPFDYRRNLTVVSGRLFGLLASKRDGES